jgi:hypothetical protein
MGYSLHIQRTRNSACVAAYNAQLEPLESVMALMAMQTSIRVITSQILIWNGWKKSPPKVCELCITRNDDLHQVQVLMMVSMMNITVSVTKRISLT